MHLEQAIRTYLDWLVATRTMSEHTLRAYQGDLAALAHNLGAETPVGTVSAGKLVEFIVAQRQRGLAASTIRRRASATRGFCRWLTRVGAVSEDPWRDVDIRIRQPKRLPRPARDESVKRLLAWLCHAANISRATVPVGPFERSYEANTLVAVALMVGTGVRVGEVAQLRGEDFDAGANSIRVVGKGARDRQVFLSSDWFVGLIQAQLETRSMLGVPHQRILFNRSGGMMATASLRARMRNAARSAGLVEHLTPHMLRHTAATQLVDSGVDIRFVQRLLGHASLTTTEQYTHVADASLRRVMAEADILGLAIT